MNLNSNRNFAFAAVLGSTLLFAGACHRSAAPVAEKPKHTEKPLNAYWTELDRIPADIPPRPETLPASYRVLKLDLPTLRNHLNKGAASAGGKSVVEMPMPTGRQMAFTVTESAVMDAKLANRYAIKTYQGTATSNPATALRMELTPRGLKATVTEGSSRYLIDPYISTDTVLYISYERMSNKARQNQQIQLKGQPEKPVQANE